MELSTYCDYGIDLRVASSQALQFTTKCKWELSKRSQERPKAATASQASCQEHSWKAKDDQVLQNVEISTKCCSVAYGSVQFVTNNDGVLQLSGGETPSARGGSRHSVTKALL